MTRGLALPVWMLALPGRLSRNFYPVTEEQSCSKLLIVVFLGTHSVGREPLPECWAA